MNNHKKRIPSYFVCLVAAGAVILLCSSNTSPLFGFEFGDYNGNNATTSLLMGKAWLKGFVPYRDLFASGGPLYYAVQAFGWAIGGKKGVMVIQILAMSLTLYLLLWVYERLGSEKSKWCCLLLTAISVGATLGGGDSEEEFCLLLSAAALSICIYGRERNSFSGKSWFFMGVLLGGALMVKFTAAGALYGVLFYMLIFNLRDKEWKRLFRFILLFLSGVAICVLPFVLYFAVNGALGDMLQAVFAHNGKSLFVNLTDLNLLFHKMVKCVPAGLLFLYGLFILLKKKNNLGILFLLIGMFLGIFGLGGGGYWYLYLPAVFCLPMVFCCVMGSRPLQMGVACLLLVFCSVPIYRYSTFVFTENRSAYYDMTTDLIGYQKSTGDKTMLLVDIPAFVYLETDVIPSYKYFAQQSTYSDTDSYVREELNNYIIDNCEDTILAIWGRGWMYEQVGDYVMVDAYYPNGGWIALYEYMPGAKLETDGN